MSRGLRIARLPLRVQLTLWYLATFALILALSGVLVYWQVQRSLLAQIDAALYLVVAQAHASVLAEDGHLSFQGANRAAGVTHRVGDDAAIFLLDSHGQLRDRLGDDTELQPFAPDPGLRTYRREDDSWRVFTELVNLPGEPNAGRIQVAQSLEEEYATLTTLKLQLYWGLPLALALAGLGGDLLASRALAPIASITQTAQAINGSDLTRRIAYSGPPDEVGLLAATFDDMLDRLQAAFARERRFTADAAHELRTPLAALKGRIGVTLSQPRQPGEYTDTLQEMDGQVDRLIRLTGDLLFMARLDQQSLQLERTDIELSDLLGAVIDQVRPLAESKALLLAVNIPAGLYVRGDLDLLIRLFLNLLDNAVKYTPAHGQIAVDAEPIGAQVVVAVRDSGPGIPAVHLPHLFERFYRVEDARQRATNGDKLDGAGLGLAIAYEIAVAQGASLHAQSAPGEGATFVLHLPLSRQSAA